LYVLKNLMRFLRLKFDQNLKMINYKLNDDFKSHQFLRDTKFFFNIPCVHNRVNHKVAIYLFIIISFFFFKRLG
jgi:hypothetical protein